MRWFDTTNGPKFCVDDQDAEYVAEYTWSVVKKPQDNTWYVRRNGAGCLLLHRLLMSAPDGLVVDHKDGDGLNNQRHNMRVITNAQNLKNRRKTLIVGGRKVSSQYKGVNSTSGGWKSTIWYEGKSRYLGTYRTEIEAALKYDEASRQHHGEYGRVNFPDGPPLHDATGRITQSEAGYAREARKRQAA